MLLYRKGGERYNKLLKQSQKHTLHNLFIISLNTSFAVDVKYLVILIYKNMPLR